MKIANSAISLSSNRVYESHTDVKQTRLQVSADGNAARKLAAVYEKSENSVTWSAGNQQKREEGQEERQRKEMELLNALNMTDAARQSQWSVADVRETLRDMRETLLNKLLEALKGLTGADSLKVGELKRGGVLDLRSPFSRMTDTRSRLFSAGTAGLPAAGTTSSGTVWKRITSVSATRFEREETSFQSQGFAVTEDGRAFHFDVSFTLSRSFAANYEAITSEDVVMTDPLIINLDGGAPSLSGTKFDFDLDGDGVRERVSFAGNGNGFLALDTNGNGVIDDGNELFGTKSGDGFADLAAHDADGNGWIDENDAVYSKLRVWTRDANGKDRLLTLKEADVGAIYLGSADTEFSLNDPLTNEINGMVRKSGVYLRESGGAGTLSHVDLRC